MGGNYLNVITYDQKLLGLQDIENDLVVIAEDGIYQYDTSLISQLLTFNLPATDAVLSDDFIMVQFGDTEVVFYAFDYTRSFTVEMELEETVNDIFAFKNKLGICTTRGGKLSFLTYDDLIPDRLTLDYNLIQHKNLEFAFFDDHLYILGLDTFGSTVLVHERLSGEGENISKMDIVLDTFILNDIDFKKESFEYRFDLDLTVRNNGSETINHFILNMTDANNPRSAVGIGNVFVEMNETLTPGETKGLFFTDLICPCSLTTNNGYQICATLRSPNNQLDTNPKDNSSCFNFMKSAIREKQNFAVPHLPQSG